MELCANLLKQIFQLLSGAVADYFFLWSQFKSVRLRNTAVLEYYLIETCCAIVPCYCSSNKTYQHLANV